MSATCPLPPGSLAAAPTSRCVSARYSTCSARGQGRYKPTSRNITNQLHGGQARLTHRALAHRNTKAAGAYPPPRPEPAPQQAPHLAEQRGAGGLALRALEREALCVEHQRAVLVVDAGGALAQRLAHVSVRQPQRHLGEAGGGFTLGARGNSRSSVAGKGLQALGNTGHVRALLCHPFATPDPECATQLAHPAP